jgi:hypothetical protein
MRTFTIEDEEVTVEIGATFQHKERERTSMLSLTHRVGDPETEALCADLRAAGWDVEPSPAPPLDGVAETGASKRGTDLFCGWTEAEREANMREAREILARHGFDDVPDHSLTWQDCC